MSSDIFNILILIGCGQGLLLAGLLFRNSRFKKKSNSYLALMILSFSVSNYHSIFLDAKLARQYIVIYFLPIAWVLLIPFAFYFFVQYLMNPVFVTGRKFFWLLFPFVVHVILQTIIFILFLTRSPILQRYGNVYRLTFIGIEIFSICFSFVIMVIVIRDIDRYQRMLKDNYSELKNKTLKWLQNLIISLAVLWLLWSLPYFYEVYTNQFLQWHHYPLWIGMSIVIYWIGYSTYSRTEVFQPVVFEERASLLKAPLPLSDRTEEHHQRLIELLREKKPYLNPELSLEMLAQEIDLSAGYLSQIINKKEMISFYDLINKYRVEEAKQIIANPEFTHYSLVAIGQEAGFNSKSTFNMAFKKYAGLTPSAFRRTLEAAR